MNHYENVKLLRCAEQLTIPYVELLGSHYKIKLDTHSTATHLHIYAVLGDEKLLVYYKTNWVSSTYEFNERGKIVGFQCAGPWVQEVTEWFDKVQAAISEEETLCAAEKTKQAEEEKKEYRAKVKHFTKEFKQTYEKVED